GGELRTNRNRFRLHADEALSGRRGCEPFYLHGNRADTGYRVPLERISVVGRVSRPVEPVIIGLT
ncbi:MAG: hypothetical protein JWN70_5875, partial [Planctomycetaceae bacterium]|nr:hypothetical protein [Planctomycetaceae bacterium]